MPGLYEVYIKDYFAAAHVLKGYDGACANMHGHNWIVEAYIQCTKLNQLGIGIDFLDVQAALKDVLSKLDHTFLNENPAFANINPTSETLSEFLFAELSQRLNTEHIRVSKVMVLESPGCGSSFQEA
ncbi:MAG: 6-carboxytetrahydropterin synthase [Deltaproteobacteria bacterium]|uniref:6-carboxytetrahydropterin synthase n=1 Tax=Desulfobacula sp. TaxID=2593537 RepID=UPI001982B45F|nr:6-carboxytetrahydropterin synthase [Candidatus Desulfobacula maris]MBL6993186.1 6-carboxytetrahydropterin synthase [Desulfobacula sp.]